MAEIVLNGKPRTVEPGSTLKILLEELGLDPRWIVAEKNGDPVARNRFDATVLADGDRIELVRPVAGG